MSFEELKKHIVETGYYLSIHIDEEKLETLTEQKFLEDIIKIVNLAKIRNTHLVILVLKMRYGIGRYIERDIKYISEYIYQTMSATGGILYNIRSACVHYYKRSL